jgi:PAS domain S-box-containing protein
MFDIESDLTKQIQLAALEATEDGIVITDSSGEILWVNQAFSRMCGYSHDEMIGNKPSMLSSGRHTADFYQQLWGTILAGKVWRSEIYNRRKDGTIYPEEESITPMLDEAGEISHFIAVKRDITERKNQEHLQLRTKKALLALSSVNAALVHIKNEDELLCEVCRVITEFAGYRLAWVGYAEHDSNKSIRPVAQSGFDDGYLETVNLTWSDSERGRGPGGTAVRTGRPCVIMDILNDVRFRPWREQARQRGFESVIGLPLKDGNDSLGVLLIYSASPDAFDTEEVALLGEMADDLAFGIKAIRGEGERLLIQRQLQQAQKMEAIGHLTGGIAHDFNNMLASILGYAELSLEELAQQDDSALLNYLQQIHHAGDQAKNLVSQLLTFSRNNDAALSPTDLQTIIKGTQGILTPLLPASITMCSHIDDELPAVMSDPVQLQQIIMNLCINARDAIEEHGQLNIGLRLSHSEDRVCSSCHQHFSGDLVELYVADNGCGIDAQSVDKIFDPFYTTKEMGEGTGMGLSTVHGIVHEHGGHMVVDSTVGKGSRFRIFLPPSEHATDESFHASFSSDSIRKYQLSGKVLVVDDELSVAAFIGELLKSCGCEVALETESSVALEHFTASPQDFDLAILDQRMSGLMGNELAEAMLQQRKELPIIICSASSSEAQKSRAVELGVKAYMEKPLDSIALLEKVSELLADSPAVT